MTRRAFLFAAAATAAMGLRPAVTAATAAGGAMAASPGAGPAGSAAGGTKTSPAGSTADSPVPGVWQSHERLRAFRQRVLSLQPTRASTGWVDVVLVQGAARCGVKLQDEAMLRWATAWADYQTALPIGARRDSNSGLLDPGQPSRGIYLASYCGDWGAPLALTPLHLHQPNPVYLEIITRVADHILDKAVRAPDGTICHAAGLGIWVDTLYYTASVLAHAYAATGKKRYAQEAVQQCLLHAKHLRDDHTGLFYHDLNLKTGARTRNFWARGNGWIAMSLADTLALAPGDTEGYEQVLSIYRSHVKGLLQYQHASGLWRIVPEEPCASLETSGTAMLLCGMTAGLAGGWIPKSSAKAVRRGVDELTTWINAKGQLMGSEHPAGPGGWETHKLVGIGEDAYAMGAFLRLMADLGSAGLP